MEYHLSFTYGGSNMCCENIKMTTVSSLPEIMRKQIRIIDYQGPVVINVTKYFVAKNPTNLENATNLSERSFLHTNGCIKCYV